MFTTVLPPCQATTHRPGVRQPETPRFAGFDAEWKLHYALKAFDDDLKGAKDRRPPLPNEKTHEKAITLAYREALGKESLGEVPAGRLVKNMMYYIRNYTMRTMVTKDYAPGGKKYKELQRQEWCNVTDNEDSQSDTEWHRSTRGEDVFQDWYQGKTRDSDAEDWVEFSHSRPRRSATKETLPAIKSEPPEPRAKRTRRSTTKASEDLPKPSVESSPERPVWSKRRGNRRGLVESRESTCESGPELSKPMVPARLVVKKEDSVDGEPCIELGTALPSPETPFAPSYTRLYTPRQESPFARSSQGEKSPFSWYPGNSGLFSWETLSRAATPGLDFKEELVHLAHAAGKGPDKRYDIRDLAHYFVLAHASHDKSLIAADMVRFIRDLERDKLKAMDFYLHEEEIPPASEQLPTLKSPERPVLSPQGLVAWLKFHRQGGLNHAGFRALARLVREQERESYHSYLFGSGPSSPMGLQAENPQWLDAPQTSPEKHSSGRHSRQSSQTPVTSSVHSRDPDKASSRQSAEPFQDEPLSPSKNTLVGSHRQSASQSPHSRRSTSFVSEALSPEGFRPFSEKRLPRPEPVERLSQPPDSPFTKAARHSRQVTPASRSRTPSIVSKAQESFPSLPSKESFERLQDLYFEAVFDFDDQLDLDTWRLPYFNRRRNESGEPIELSSNPKGYLTARQIQDASFENI